MLARPSVVPLIIVFLFSSTVLAEPGPPPREVRFDRNGYPLPAGAVARIGVPCPLADFPEDIAWADDGKRLVLVGWNFISTFDADTGRMIDTKIIGQLDPQERPWSIPNASTRLLSHDGRLLVRIDNGDGSLIEACSGDHFQPIQLPVPTTFDKTFSCQSHSLTLSADGRFLAGVASTYEPSRIRSLDAKPGPVWRLDLASGKHVQIGGRTDVFSVMLAPAGTHAFGVTRVDADMLVRWDLKTGWEEWSLPLDRPMTIQAVSRDGRRVAVAGKGKLQVFDAETPKLLFDMLHQYEPWDGHGSMAFSPDGRLLALTGKEVIVRELAGGKILHRFPHPASLVSFSPDGRSLVTAGLWVQRWDLATGRPKYPEPRNGHAYLSASHLRWSADGNRLLAAWTTAGYGTTVSPHDALEVMDLASLSPSWRMPIPSIPLDVAFDSAGQIVRACTRDDRLRIWNLGPATSEAIIELRPSPKNKPPHRDTRSAGFFPDGRLVTVSMTGEMTVDTYAPAGRHLRRTTAPYPNVTDGLPQYLHAHLTGHPGIVLGPLKRPAPSGIAFGNPQEPPKILPYPRTDVATGRWLPPLENPWTGRNLDTDDPLEGGVGLIGFHPNGYAWGIRPSGGGIVWDAPTGRVVVLMKELGGVLSPDGRWVAGNARRDWGIDIHKLDSEMPVVRDGFVNYPQPVPVATHAVPRLRRLVFSPDGRRLASAHADGTILLWDVPRVTPAPWVPADAERLWNDLAAEDMVLVWKNLWHLLDHPDKTMELLNARLRPVIRREAAIGLIARLDSPRFAVREAASLELARRDDCVEHELRAALKKPVSTEQQERLTLLVKKLDSRTQLSPDILRALRGVWLLERLGTPAARRRLTEIAAGPPDERVTLEAMAALDRLPK
ncbi:WD40 repeat domain-containing protein [Zavarzinella formosa]|uniref:WD40 repeat domain-containing protein n=1 Tax=Zavarzinella formosa TaxID=360055 RepID=UPI0002D73101|nr:WD40 repeat domain-containing protein [Zavarzinella formosa]